MAEELYVRGLETRDFFLIRAACTPDALLLGVDGQGGLDRVRLDDWTPRFDPADPPFRELAFTIARVDQNGVAAQVRIDFVMDGDRLITDYLNMLRLRDEWRIVNIIDNG